MRRHPLPRRKMIAVKSVYSGCRTRLIPGTGSPLTTATAEAQKKSAQIIHMSFVYIHIQNIRTRQNTYMKLKSAALQQFCVQSFVIMGKAFLRDWNGYVGVITQAWSVWPTAKQKLVTFIPCHAASWRQAQTIKKTLSLSTGEGVETAKSQLCVAAKEDMKQAPLSVNLAMATLARLQDPIEDAEGKADKACPHSFLVRAC